jgi:hypothetical protein
MSECWEVLRSMSSSLGFKCNRVQIQIQKLLSTARPQIEFSQDVNARLAIQQL